MSATGISSVFHRAEFDGPRSRMLSVQVSGLKLLMPRYFTREQAEGLLPVVQEAMRQVASLKALLDEAAAEVRAETTRIMMAGGAVVRAEAVASARNRAQSLTPRLQDAVESVQRHGCIVKDLDEGLVDFPTLYRGQEVYLCWKSGEPRIEFWHSMEEGFPGRKPIDDDFLQHHTGEYRLDHRRQSAPNAVTPGSRHLCFRCSDTLT